jgi:nucleotide-binding universal stress UspA family protein
MLIAVDGSEAALEGVRFAARIASQLSERDLVLLYVRPSHTGAVFSLGAPGPIPEARLEQELSAVESEVLDEARAVLRQAGLDASQQLETGAPAAAICRVAEEGGFDLVVLGSRGHGELKSLLVGSTTDAVIHSACCPVLVVRGPGPIP